MNTSRPCVRAYLLVFVVFRDFRPEPDQPILEILVDPKASDMCAMVGVPTTILAPRRGVHVQNCINPVFRACGYGTVEVLETISLEYTWIHVIFEMTIADRDADAVKSK